MIEALLEGIDKRRKETNKEIDELKTKLQSLESLANPLDVASNLLMSIKKTPQMDDPGKYQLAAYFVKNLFEDDAGRGNSDNHITRPCKKCKKQSPVIMGYQQTNDSPDGDEWTKYVYTVCENDGAQEIRSFTSEYRF